MTNGGVAAGGANDEPRASLRLAGRSHGEVWSFEEAGRSVIVNVRAGEEIEGDEGRLAGLRVAGWGCGRLRRRIPCCFPVSFGPVSDFSTVQKELLGPAVKGTYNVLKACSETNVKRVIIVSSVAAVAMNPNWPVDKVKDESCWSDDKYCTATNNWYCLSKTIAERDAFQYAQKHGLDVISVCPSLVLGPMLQQTPNASSSVLISLLKEGSETVQNKTRMVVDVRDVAESLLLVYEKPEAEGRYICTAHTPSVLDMVEMLKEMYANYKYPKSFSESAGIDHKVTSQRLQGLGWSFRPLEETLKDSVESYRQAGLLD